jgi:hypothetical protein
VTVGAVRRDQERYASRQTTKKAIWNKAEITKTLRGKPIVTNSRLIIAATKVLVMMAIMTELTISWEVLWAERS